MMWLPVAAMWLTSQFPTLYTKGHIVMSPMNITSHIIMWVLGLVIAEQSLAPREPRDLHATQITKPTGRGDQVIGNRGIGDLDPVVTPLKVKFNATTWGKIDKHVRLTSTTRGPTFPVR